MVYGVVRAGFTRNIEQQANSIDRPAPARWRWKGTRSNVSIEPENKF